MSSKQTFISLFSGKKLAIPILIGLGFAAYVFYSSYTVDTFSAVNIDSTTITFFALALVMVFIRFFGYALRLRILSNKQISWKSSFEIICLWEFASAITPGIVGGTAVAIGIIAQEKRISTGKSTAMVMATSYLDVLFYVLAIPILAAAVSIDAQIPSRIGPISHGTLYSYFLLAYFIFAIWTILVHVGLFVRPDLAGRVVLAIFKLPLLRRWKKSAIRWNVEITTSASELKQQTLLFWIKSFLATCIAWTARFALVNFLVLALGDGSEIISIFTKQLVMWGALMIPLTPGASGLAELMFTGFLGEYFASTSLANVTSIIWRLVSFYPYLLVGVVVFPIWMNRLFRTNK